MSAVPYKLILCSLIVALLGVASACNPQPIGGGGSSTTTTPTAQIRTLPLVVYVPTDLVAKYGGTIPMRTKVETQLYTIASRFVGFKFQLRLDVNIYTEFTSSPSWTTLQQSQVPHPAGTLLLVYSETEGLSGGWDGELRSIHHDFTEPFGGVFDENATRGLTHEFAHVFGAIDEYAIQVAAAQNPVNGTSYFVAPNYMSDPYYYPNWDAYTVGIVNKSNGAITYHGGEVTSSLPVSSKLIAKTAGGTAVGGASVKMYPVGWFTNSVNPTPFYTGLTAADGSWNLPANPFGAGTPGYPWNTRTPTYLIEVTSGGQTGDTWMSLVDAGKFYFEHPSSIYNLSVTVG